MYQEVLVVSEEVLECFRRFYSIGSNSHRQTDRQTDRQTGGQTDRQTGGGSLVRYRDSWSRSQVPKHEGIAPCLPPPSLALRLRSAPRTERRRDERRGSLPPQRD